MRGTLNVIAASGGSIKATASDSADVGQTASVLPIPVPLGNTTVTVAGGATPTNAVITLTQAVPGVGTSGTIYDDEFSIAPWQAHQTWQTGDLWAYVITSDPNGATDGNDTWWANPIATPQAAPVYPAPSGGALSLGLMTTPTGIGIAQAFIGTIINNQNSTGARLFGYHEFRVRHPGTQGFLFQWNIEDYLLSASWNVEIDFRIWVDTGGVKHARVQMSGSTIAPLIVYESTTLDITQYHIYGINWQPDHITVYVDEVQVGQALNPGGPWLTNACFAYMLTSAATYQVNDGVPTAASLPAFAQVDYYRLFSNIPTTAGVVLVHAFNAGGSSNNISDSVGQNWIRHPDARLGSPPKLTALSHNTLPMAAGSTITVSFTNPSAGTQGYAAAWYVPFINGSSFGSLANVGATGTTPDAPSITASVSGTSAITLVTLPTTGAPLDTGLVQVQYRITGTTSWTAAPSPPHYITPTNGSLLDLSGNTWTLASNGNPVINGTVTDTVSRAQEMFLITGTLWQFDGTSWYSFTPSGTITSASQLAWNGPVATSPLLSPGISVSGLAAGNYDISAYVSNSSGTGTLSNIAQVTVGSASTGPGPAATSSFITADYTSAYFYPSPGSQTQNASRGQMIISPRLYGSSDGAIANDGSQIGTFTVANGNPFCLLTSTEYVTKMATVNPGIWMSLTPPNPGIWDFGTNPPSLATNAFSNLINNFYKIDPLGVSGIVLNINWERESYGTLSQSTFGAMMHTLALFFQNQVMPNGKRCPVIGFMGQNEPSAGQDLIGYYNQIVSNVTNVTLPGGGTYIVVGPVSDNVFLGTGNWTTFSQGVPGMGVFQWDNFAPNQNGDFPMSYLQTPQSQGGISDWFSDGILHQVAPNVAYQPQAYAPQGNLSISGTESALADYRSAMWDALQHIQSANCSPVPAWNWKWSSALQVNWGFLLNPGPAGDNQISLAGYYNGRAVATCTGPRWNVPSNSGGMLCMATNPTASDLSLKIIVAGQGAQSGRIAFSHWPVNATGNGTLTMWQLTASTPNNTITDPVTKTPIRVGSNAGQAAGVSDVVNLPDPSITIISSIA